MCKDVEKLKKRILYYVVSLTWGLPLTLIGFIVAVTLMAAGYKPKRFGGCWYFAIGENWGGLELGLVFLTDKTEHPHVLRHEYGHSVQNCIFGPVTIFLCWIPSAARYWIRELMERAGHPPKADYDSFWVEKMATDYGYNTLELWTD